MEVSQDDWWEVLQDEWNNIHPCNQKNTLELSSFRMDTLTTKQLRLFIRTITQRGIEPEPSSLRVDTLTTKQPRLDKQTKLPVQHL